MTLSVVDYGTREDAYDAAEMAGFARDSVVVMLDGESDRYQWHVRGVEHSAEVADVAIDAEEAGEPVADEPALPALPLLLGHQMSDAPRWVSDRGVVDVALPAGWSVIEAGQEVDEQPAQKPVAPVQPVARQRNMIMQVHGEMAEDLMRQFAAIVAQRDKTLVTLRWADTLEVVDVIIPGLGKGLRGNGGGTVRAERAERAPVAPVAPEVKQERDWLTYDARDVCKGGNASNIKVWEAIREAAVKLDLDALRAFSFRGSDPDDGTGNTYTRNNGRYLQAQIARVERVITERDAALDAEFGFSKLAAD
jgi:hypothetical protein